MAAYMSADAVRKAGGSGNAAKLPNEDPAASDMVDTTAAVSRLVDTLEGLPTEPPSLYMDLEGVNLSRHGTISILQIYVLSSRRTFLVDVHTLGDLCFSTRGQSGRTLKDILEAEDIPKVFFDVRNDSDALYSHFNIDLAGIQDLQLMELAARTFSRRFVSGLSKCIEKDAPLSASQRLAWKQVKEKGLDIFDPQRGGGYEVFNKRPLPKNIVLYCIQDVAILPRLWTHYNGRLTPAWKRKVLETSKQRVKLSQSPDYDSQGRQKALAPQGW